MGDPAGGSKPANGPGNQHPGNSTPGGGDYPGAPRLQACAVPYRWEAGQPRYLIVTSSEGDRWIFPKGVVDPGFTPQESALAEAFEEAGARGQLSPTPYHRYPRKKWGHDWTVLVFGLECADLAADWNENYRERRWVSLEEGEALLARELRESLQAVHRQITDPGKDPLPER